MPTNEIVRYTGGFLPDILLFTQASIFVWFDGTFIAHTNIIISIIIDDTLARSVEPVVTECKEHTIHTQTQVVASRKPK